MVYSLFFLLGHTLSQRGGGLLFKTLRLVGFPFLAGYAHLDQTEMQVGASLLSWIIDVLTGRSQNESLQSCVKHCGQQHWDTSGNCPPVPKSCHLSEVLWWFGDSRMYWVRVQNCHQWLCHVVYAGPHAAQCDKDQTTGGSEKDQISFGPCFKT